MDLTNINGLIRNAKSPNIEYESFLESEAKNNPFEQFVDWLNVALKKEFKPTMMTLATVDENGFPDTRMVSLQELKPNQLIFYSSYRTRKAKHIRHNNTVAVNFYWPNAGRQVRIKAKIEKLSRDESENYFAKRNKEIQLTIHAWTPNSNLPNREHLENSIKTAASKFDNKNIPCPTHWGGYVIIPSQYEFYQRRKSLMNDIFLYTLSDGKWQRVRLTP